MKKPQVVSKRNSPKKLDPGLAIKLFANYYPDAHCALHHRNPFELLVATILSAQCTDERVNLVTPVLFEKFPTPLLLSQANQLEVESIIRSTGFFQNKSKNIIACAKALVEDFNGEIPQSLEKLVTLNGVGRKTANVVLGNAFNIASGIVVDTHVTRLSNRFGWTRSENAVVIEKDLIQLIPKEYWILISHWLITHGRSVCQARKPKCERCFLSEDCPQIL